MQKQISSTVITFGVLVILFAVSFYIFAWQEPASAPPAGNVATPLNVSNVGQIKTGNLVVNALGISSTGTAPFSMPIGAGAGKVLTSNDAGIGTWQSAAGGGGNFQVFTSSGTWTKPSGVNFVYVEVIGAGGGGGGGAGGPNVSSPDYRNGGAGGGGGARATKIIRAADLGATVAVTVGTGGSGGAGGASGSGSGGNTGGLSSFGTHVVAQGGRGGGGGG